MSNMPITDAASSKKRRIVMTICGLDYLPTYVLVPAYGDKPERFAALVDVSFNDLSMALARLTNRIEEAETERRQLLKCRPDQVAKAIGVKEALARYMLNVAIDAVKAELPSLIDDYKALIKVFDRARSVGARGDDNAIDALAKAK